MDMSSERVEELESRVEELEASVEGLTDELVECKVRLRELEDAVDADLGFVPASESTAPPESGDAEPFGIEESAEAPKGEADEETDNTEVSDSDIIVA